MGCSVNDVGKLNQSGMRTAVRRRLSPSSRSQPNTSVITAPPGTTMTTAVTAKMPKTAPAQYFPIASVMCLLWHLQSDRPRPEPAADIRHEDRASVTTDTPHAAPSTAAGTANPDTGLVPGDVIRLRLGDIVPADARLLDGDEIEVDQSALTGESLPATCATADAVFSGSIIRQGEIGALVYATGTGTYFGKIAELVQDAHTVSHFQRAVLKIGNYLILLAVALVTLIVVTAIVRGDRVLTTLQFALVFTVAAIPVAMPAVLSVTMAVGARLLAKKQAIVSRLVAIEELAGVDVLCADKTGTLTQNSLTLGTPFTVGGVNAATAILNGALASRADNDDPIDRAVLGGLVDATALNRYTVTHFTPFDPVHSASARWRSGQ